MTTKALITLLLLATAAGTTPASAEPKLRTERPLPEAGATGTIPVSLVGNKDAQPGAKQVSFAIPFPPGVLKEARLIRVHGPAGEELPVFTKELVPWRLDNKEGTVRSVLVQFECPVAAGETKKINVHYGAAGQTRATAVPVTETMVESTGQSGPNIWAVLPASWMCNSWVVGPQLPVSANANLPEYDKCAERSFDKQLSVMSSMKGSPWLFDRTTSIYKMYVRTGELKYLKAATHCAHFVRNNSAESGKFNMSRKFMLVYPRAQGIQYMFSGDPRSLSMLQAQSKYFDRIATERWAKYVPNKGMWTERNAAYAWSALVYAYEIIGGEDLWKRMVMYADRLYEHQSNPPDGKPADGSWRHRWAQHDGSEANFEGGSSAWMTALLLDPMFEYWLLSGDERVPEMVTRWCEFLVAKGLNPAGTKAWYVINALDGGGSHDSSMEQHNIEMAYMLAMGTYFSTDKEQQERFLKPFNVLYKSGTKSTHTRPPRRFNWCFQNSSVMTWFMAQ
jgi:hypothetical protein